MLRDKWVLAVAGHARQDDDRPRCLRWILERAGLEPGFLIGGVPINFDVSARLTDSAFFVIEADEYDTAFFDKRSKFVHYRPRTAILNNLEYDHADIFPDLAAIETQFHHLVRTVPARRPADRQRRRSGARARARARLLERDRALRRRGFGRATPARALDDRRRRRDHARRRAAGQAAPFPHHRPPQPAECARRASRPHAMPACRSRRASRALASFRGVKRRMELRGTRQRRHRLRRLRAPSDGDRDDARRTCAATSATARILAVLEPRSNTMKLGTMKARCRRASRRPTGCFATRRNLGWDAAAALAPLGARAEVHDDLDALVDAVARDARPATTSW